MVQDVNTFQPFNENFFQTILHGPIQCKVQTNAWERAFIITYNTTALGYNEIKGHSFTSKKYWHLKQN